MKKTSSILIISFLILSFFCFLSIAEITQGYKESKTTINKKFNQDISYSYTTHAPISIANDVQLNATASSGNGTSINPYVIEGWNITTTSTHGISIRDTTKYFIIRNCWIDSTAPYMGIFVYNLSPYTANITDNTCTGCFAGIVVLMASNVTITNNFCFYNSEYGITSNYADGIIVENNTCNYNQNEDGIALLQSQYSTAIENTCIGNGGAGINLVDGNNSIVMDNLCKENTYVGINLWNASRGLFTGNILVNNSFFGFSSTLDGHDCIIHHNYFTNNNQGGFSQAADYGSGNIWYEVSTSQGNYWSDYSGTGNYMLDGTSGSYDPFPLDIVFPTFTTSPGDIFYEYGITGNSIEWIAYANKPSTYYIYENSVQIETGNWYNMTPITISVDGLEVGIYTYQIIIYDIHGNFEVDNVIVTVGAVAKEFREIAFLIPLLSGFITLTILVRKKKR